MEQEEIIAVFRNHFGDIISFQTSNGRIISYRKALAEAMEERITGIDLVELDNGAVDLVSSNGDDFDHLPSFH